MTRGCLVWQVSGGGWGLSLQRLMCWLLIGWLTHGTCKLKKCSDSCLVEHKGGKLKGLVVDYQSRHSPQGGHLSTRLAQADKGVLFYGKLLKGLLDYHWTGSEHTMKWWSNKCMWIIDCWNTSVIIIITIDTPMCGLYVYNLWDDQYILMTSDMLSCGVMHNPWLLRFTYD